MMKRILFTGLFSLVLPFSYVKASAVRGCEIDAKVITIRVEAPDKKAEVTLELETITAKPTGHSAGEAICAPPGTKFTFAVDNDEELLAAKVKEGDSITVEDIMIYNVDASGHRAFLRQDYLKTLASGAATTSPTIITPPTITPKQTKTGGCQVDPEGSGLGLAWVIGAFSLLLRRRA